MKMAFLRSEHRLGWNHKDTMSWSDKIYYVKNKHGKIDTCGKK